MNIKPDQLQTVTRTGNGRSNGNGSGRHVHSPVAATDAEQMVYQLLGAIGEDPDRQGLQRTPERAARMYEEMFARRLQVQERMTQEIAELIDETLQPLGVGVVIQGQHMCSMMRGVKKAQASMITSALLGSFEDNPQTRAEFMAHIYMASSAGGNQ